jgi:hypothetical protein
MDQKPMVNLLLFYLSRLGIALRLTSDDEGGEVRDSSVS